MCSNENIMDAVTQQLDDVRARLSYTSYHGNGSVLGKIGIFFRNFRLNSVKSVIEIVNSGI